MRVNEKYSTLPAEDRSVHIINICAIEDIGYLPSEGTLLNSLSVDPDAECKYGLYFRDGKRKVDYILVYHHKRASGGRTLARRAQHSDQPLPGKTGPLGAGEPEPPLDYHEDDKRFRREEYEGNLVEAGLELERDEDVTQKGPLSSDSGNWEEDSDPGAEQEEEGTRPTPGQTPSLPGGMSGS